MDKNPPKIGSDVHYVDSEKRHRPAKVIAVEQVKTAQSTHPSYVVELEVFGRQTLAGMTSGIDERHPMAVQQDESNTKHVCTWHWPEED